MTDADVLFVNSLGPGFTLATARGPKGLGGSELEIVQIAHALANRGHRVIVANGVTETTVEEGVTYMPLDRANGLRTNALWIERSTTPPRVHTKRVVIRATDQNGSWYDMHKEMLRSGQAAVAVNGQWHARGFPEAKEKIIIPPALDYDVGGLLPPKMPGLFVYASAPMKGLEETLATWRRLRPLWREKHDLKLKIVVPGFSDMSGDKVVLRDGDDKLGITFEGMPSLVEWRRAIASAEGMFFVNTLQETYGCAAAFAEHYRTRVHILCRGEIAGFEDSLSLKSRKYVTTKEEKFFLDFINALGSDEEFVSRRDQSPDALAPIWEDALHLPRGSVPKTIDRAAALSEFKQRLEGLESSGVTMSEYWKSRVRTLVALSKTQPIEDFLLWTNDFDHVHIPVYQELYEQITKSPEWESRWKRLTRTPPGIRVHDSPFDPETSGVLSQHAHTLAEYEKATGAKLTDDIDVVVEFGGGFGNLARVLRADGYTGAHVIVDLPVTREFQRAYLKMCGIEPATEPSSTMTSEGVTLLVEKDIPRLLTALAEAAKFSEAGKRVAFVAMWSLSEVPISLRKKLFPALHKHCERYLVQAQWPHHSPEPEIDNEKYFTKFMKDAGVPFTCVKPDAFGGDWPARFMFAPKRESTAMTAPRSPLHDMVMSEVRGHSAEQEFEQEKLPTNKPPLGPKFGEYLSLMRNALSSGGSEYGLGLMLMSLTASVRAERVVEIGRFHGFSTVALASGLALADAGWQEPTFARQRPDVNYDQLLAKKKRTLWSIDAHPTKEAAAVVKQAGLESYVETIDAMSDDVDPARFGAIDVLLIDGSHELVSVRRDVARFVPYVRPNGYFILHDYFGWYQDGKNGSPIKKAIDEDLKGFEQILIDTGFASFVIFRKNTDALPVIKKAPPRKDGRPTVGLVLIAKGDEAATIIARAIVSVSRQVDAITVVSDGGNRTAEVCRALGADVHLRPTPETDWVTGDGFITRARNEALAIAEHKTDYVLMLDPDDYYEGEIPNELTADAYQLNVHDGDLQYPRPQLYKSSRGFRYRGIVHEVLHVPQGTVGIIELLKYMRGHGGHQDTAMSTKQKFMKHARMLERWLSDHPEDARSQFYLAQSYRDASEPDKAIPAYERRIEMTVGWDEERAFSACQIARILRDTGKDPTMAYLRAYELRPTRAEPLCELANWLRDEKQKRFDLAVIVAERANKLPIPKGDVLFLAPQVYQWRALEELAIALYWTGQKAAAKTAFEQLLDRAPVDYRPHVRSMVALCARELG